MADLDLGDTRLIIETCKDFDLLRNQAAYVLATAFWETNRTMHPVQEAYWLSETWRKNNLRYYPWHGRGYVQLTWERNYVRAGKELHMDLTTNPAVAMEPTTAAEILVAGCKEGWFTGKKLRDYITLQQSDYKGARRIVNGTDKAAAIAGIAKDYDAALLAEGYGVTDDEPVTPPVIDKPDTPPKEHPIQSKTIMATLFQLLAALGAFGTAIWESASENVQMILAVGMMLIIAAAFFIMRERLKKWADGIR